MIALVMSVGGCDLGSGSQGPEGLDFDGPLYAGTDVGTICMPGRGSTDFTFGSAVVRYSGTETLTVTDVALVDDSVLSVEEAFAADLKPTLVGSWSRWPPPGGDQVVASMSNAVGLRLGQRATTEANIVVHLTRPNKTIAGQPTALRLRYEVGGDEYAVDTSLELGIQRENGEC